MGPLVRRFVSRGVILGSLVVLIACTRTHSPSSLVSPRLLFACPEVAVLPFVWRAPDDPLYEAYVSERAGGRRSESVPDGMGIARQVAVALGERGVAATAMAVDGALTLQAQVDVLRGKGYACVLLGQVDRYEERVGSDWSVSRPASVAFKVLFFDSATGQVVWTGGFDETQHSLSENLLTLTYFISRKARWVTASHLLEDGVRYLVETMVQEGGNLPEIGEPPRSQ